MVRRRDSAAQTASCCDPLTDSFRRTSAATRSRASRRSSGSGSSAASLPRASLDASASGDCGGAARRSETQTLRHEAPGAAASGSCSASPTGKTRACTPACGGARLRRSSTRGVSSSSSGSPASDPPAAPPPRGWRARGYGPVPEAAAGSAPEERARRSGLHSRSPPCEQSWCSACSCLRLASRFAATSTRHDPRVSSASDGGSPSCSCRTSLCSLSCCTVPSPTQRHGRSPCAFASERTTASPLRKRSLSRLVPAGSCSATFAPRRPLLCASSAALLGSSAQPCDTSCLTGRCRRRRAAQSSASSSRWTSRLKWPK
mmetsp:Transcript_9281/g.30822  ORF Transcript_9281/g.30822 Transcript_9281/m.30822 type:complete len:317 (-) Transcript_9281:360-1310(-)